MKILSCGAGMQSTALALMSCENTKENKYPRVPVYDAVIFCDLGKEPPWVYNQVRFIQTACEAAGIPFYILDVHLYQDYIMKFGKSRVVTIPFWSVDENGKKGKMTRHCTIDYKILAIQKFFRWTLLEYKKGQRTKPEDVGAHEMHIGFSTEEQQRIFDSYHPMFVNKFPLIEMGLERKDNYAYIRDAWGLETKASACQFCPFHKNYFFKYLKENHTAEYEDLIEFDGMLEVGQPSTSIKSKVFISRSRKRIKDLLPEECNDKECFKYKSEDIWNGF
jgi:hypothetical protein